MLFLTSPTRVEYGASGLKLKCVKNELGETDESGRQELFLRGSDFLIRQTLSLMPWGRPRLFFLPQGIVFDEQSIAGMLGSTALPAVFACGDITGGSRTVFMLSRQPKERQSPWIVTSTAEFEGLETALKIGENGNISFKRYMMAHSRLKPKKRSILLNLIQITLNIRAASEA